MTKDCRKQGSTSINARKPKSPPKPHVRQLLSKLNLANSQVLKCRKHRVNGNEISLLFIKGALCLAKQKQQLELEQQELELLKLRKEQILRVEELEEENRRILAEATLTEMALRDDLSDSTTDFHEILWRFSASSKGKETERISEWISNSPGVAESNPAPTVEAQTTSTSNNYVIFTAR